MRQLWSEVFVVSCVSLVLWNVTGRGRCVKRGLSISSESRMTMSLSINGIIVTRARFTSSEQQCMIKLKMCGVRP